MTNNAIIVGLAEGRLEDAAAKGWKRVESLERARMTPWSSGPRCQRHVPDARTESRRTPSARTTLASAWPLVAAAGATITSAGR